MSDGERDTTDWVAVALEEYRTLRAESLGAIEQMQRTLQIGLVAIGVITGFGVDASQSGAGVHVGIATATPAFAALVIVMWLDELRRAVFAGAQIAQIEHRIALRYEPDDAPLTWESQIQTDYNPKNGYRYIRHWATTGALFAASLPMVVTGLYRLADENEWELFAGAAIGSAVVLVITAIYQHRVHDAMSDKHRVAREELGLESS